MPDLKSNLWAFDIRSLSCLQWWLSDLEGSAEEEKNVK